MGNLSSWVDDFFDTDQFRSGELTVPAVNVLEAIKHYTLEMAVPGKNKSDFKISVDDNGLLTISMESKSDTKREEKGLVKRREYNYSSFSRSFTLPASVDASKISAAYENGLLTVYLPKLEAQPEKKGKEISIA